MALWLRSGRKLRHCSAAVSSALLDQYGGVAKAAASTQFPPQDHTGAAPVWPARGQGLARGFFWRRWARETAAEVPEARPVPKERSAYGLTWTDEFRQVASTAMQTGSARCANWPTSAHHIPPLLIPMVLLNKQSCYFSIMQHHVPSVNVVSKQVCCISCS